ncbi:DNA phosphorothioation-dependent restriction protein DptF [Halorubellus salinus]|uniref:DNA phosphorothioation-dependent restriction protein DptF n=1 Tax=Halorubellus salinus TaxID=755309 RepID=UPI001D064E0A|nr:DNA phosphorothioation-dependent restriction protein DptF [Halorubellus salinus]
MTDGEDAGSSPVNSLEEAAAAIVRLRLGRPGAVVASLTDSNAFMESIYVPTRADELAREFFSSDEPDGELFVLLGSTGDGKTAILRKSYQESDADWLHPKLLRLDATESKSDRRSNHDEMDLFLEKRGEEEGGETPRRGLAINLGIALTYFHTENRIERFPKVWDAIDNARDYTNLNPGGIYRGEEVTVVNLSFRRMFDTHPKTLGQGLLAKIIRLFDYNNEESPFAAISDEIEATQEENPLAYNLHKLSNPEVQESLIRLFAARAIISNEYLNPRRVLDYLSKILISAGLQEEMEEKALPTFEELLDAGRPVEETYIWNTVYDVLARPGHESAHLDPCLVSGLSLDEWILNPEFDMQDGAVHYDRLSGSAINRTVVRLQHLTGEVQRETEEVVEDGLFETFAGARTHHDAIPQPGRDGDREYPTEEFMFTAYDTIVEAIRNWSQQARDGELVEIPDGQNSIRYQFLSEWNQEKAGYDEQTSVARTTEETQLGKLWFAFNNEVKIPLSYELYRLLELLTRGYNPEAIDPKESEGVRLIRTQLSQFTEKKEQLEVRNLSNQLLLRVQEGEGPRAGTIQLSDS